MSDCASCPEGMPANECPDSQRACGHHCNCSWVQDVCHWCGEEFGDEMDEELKVMMRREAVKQEGP